MLVVSLRDVNHRLLSYLLWSGRNATRRQVSSVFRVAREGKKKNTIHWKVASLYGQMKLEPRSDWISLRD